MPAPKKASVGVSLTNARGVLCADACPKLIGKVVRRASIPTLSKFAGEGQLGSIAGRGTDFASATVRALFLQCSSSGLVQYWQPSTPSSLRRWWDGC